MRLPFTESQFLDIFAAYNAAVWPVVVALWVVTCAFVIQLARGRAGGGALVALAAVHWLWSGLVYHAVFFTRINTAAWLFALLFFAQAFAFFVYAVTYPSASFTLQRTPRHVLAGLFLIYSLLYPGLVLLSGHAFPRAPGFAVPCPTTLFTAGLLLAAEPPVPRWLLVGPVMWSFIAGTAALTLGMTPDLMLFAAGGSLLLYAALPQSRGAERVPLPGDEIVANPRTEYTMALTIRATPAKIWPWLVQMGQGRGGFYTHEWVENLLGADIHNADRVVPALQRLAVGDRIRLTPDPYLGRPGQFMVVAAVQPKRAVVFRQTLSNGATATWALVLIPEKDKTTRVLLRRRGGTPTWFDRVMKPGYLFMDRGVLRGLRERAEARVM